MAKALGKGLNALFPGEDLNHLEKVEKIDLVKIKPNPFQPRKIFEEEAMADLSESIKEHGVLQPIIVRKKGSKYEIVVGERRFRASELAGLEEIPAVVRELNDQQMMEISYFRKSTKRRFDGNRGSRSLSKSNGKFKFNAGTTCI